MLQVVVPMFWRILSRKSGNLRKNIPSQNHFSQNGQNLSPQKNHYSNFQTVYI